MPSSRKLPRSPIERRDGPRERLLRDGAEGLSSEELIAIVLGTGTRNRSVGELAAQLLRRFGSLDALARAGTAELGSAAGMGPAKTASVRAAFELGARWSRAPLDRGAKLASPEQVVAHYGPRLRHYRQEVFVVVLLDSRQRVLGQAEVHRGSLDQSLVHPREVFAPALRESAAGILVLHNHPSGDPTPSREDRDVTRRLVQAGEILGIRVIDHVVIAANAHCSFARAGLLDSQATPQPRR
jgi:DNA repair protein RadC